MKVDELVERLRETAKVGRGAGSNKSSREIADGLDEAADALKAMKEALVEARAALHQHYVDWDGEPEDAVSLQLARAKIDATLNQGVPGDVR
jgi:uncharacterized Rossmann fold enzyme